MNSSLSDSPRARRRLSFATAAILLLLPLQGVAGQASAARSSTESPAAAARDTWRPRLGADFNNPVGRPAARTLLIKRVLAAVKHTHSGETIRFAMYSFDRRDLTDALLKAHRRGVNVQIIVNDNWTSAGTNRLRRALGQDADKDHFVVICEGSCRGGPGNLHLKVYSFTKTGAANNVIMTGSSNLTERAVSLQWNDLFSIAGNSEFFDTFVQVFNQLKRDKPVKPRWVYYTSDSMDATFYRDSDASSRGEVRSRPATRLPTQEEDPVMQRLRAVRCDAMRGSGINGHTVIRIMMYAWQDERGKYLARRVADMKRRGCDVKVILSVPGGGVVRALRARSVPMRSADYQYNSEGKVNFYSHLKVLTVNGTYHRKPTQTVWTGSENWSRMSFRNDELIMQINNRGVYRDYVDHFNFLWAHGTHPLGVHPTTKP